MNYYTKIELQSDMPYYDLIREIENDIQARVDRINEIQEEYQQSQGDQKKCFLMGKSLGNLCIGIAMLKEEICLLLEKAEEERSD